MLSWNIEKNELEKKQYNTAGLYSFINRFTDTGFKTKWCGIWVPPIKAFEYYSYKINGTWLSGNNSTRCTIKPWGSKHYFSLDGLDVTETVFAPDEYPSVISVLHLKNRTRDKQKIDISIEAAVNIRTKEENLHDRTYETGYNDLRNSVFTSSEIGCSMFGAGKTEIPLEIKNRFIKDYKNHNPGSPQRCFIPSVYSVSLNLGPGEDTKIPIIYCATTKSKDALTDAYDYCAQNWSSILTSKVKKSVEIYHNHDINTPDDRLDKTYIWTQYNLLGLLNRSELGLSIFAGYPWFLEFWGRDVFWSLLGLIDMGEFGTAKEIFRTMAKNQEKKMPCIIHLDGTKEFHGADIDPLFLITLMDYEKKSGDMSLRKELKSNIDTSLKDLELMDYIVTHKPDETWMDSIERPGSAVEIQAMWIEALKTLEPKLSMKMNTRLNQNFWNNDKKNYYDTYSTLPNPEVTANSLVPLFFGLTPDAKGDLVLERAKTELKSIYGIRTRSKTSKNYNPSGYHTGSCWGLTTGWGAVAFLRYGMTETGLNCLDDFAYDSERFQPGALSEVIDAETGSLLGTTEQAWSSSLFIYAIDDYLFGIKPDMQDNHIRIEPRIPDTWGHMYKTGKKAGAHTFDLKIERTTGGIEARIDFKKDPKGTTCELILPGWIKSIEHKGKKVKKNILKFRLEKENIITGYKE
ncbi:MAG: amylo-alpha-1,6-glucosidase [archaeon]